MIVSLFDRPFLIAVGEILDMPNLNRNVKI